MPYMFQKDREGRFDSFADPVKQNEGSSRNGRKNKTGRAKKSRKNQGKVWVKKKTRHIQNLAISKKSTIIVQSSWNLAKMIASWANHFHQVSLGLD